jgi:iron-sulfur cluster repair protein YtfE (RIC family)
VRSPTASLHDHHLELLPHVAFIRSAADAVGHSSTEDLIEDVDEVLGFLTHALLPHAEVEDRIIYPAVDKAAGSCETTRTMSRDHVEIARLAEQLRRMRPRAYAAGTDTTVAREFRRVLYGLHAILSLHVAKEEELLFPLLEDRLTDAEARALTRAIAQVGTAALAD